MAGPLRYEIIGEDKIGMTLSILTAFYNKKVNINSLEVFPRKVCIKIDDMSHVKMDEIEKDVLNIDGVIGIKRIQLLSYEENERRLIAMIDSVAEGIIAVNKNLEVEIFNRYCENLFGMKKEEVLGTDVRDLISENAPMVNLLETGEKYDNLEFKMDIENGQLHYLTTGRPILGDNGEILGAVASIEDIEKAIELANVVSVTDQGAFKEVVGNSRAIEQVKKIAATVAKSNSTILLRGESGTGKEVFARAIHNLSDRSSCDFIAINCAALPESLLESELFGYEKGSFTGALDTGKDGLFVKASGSTLFLDEIGELSMPLQAKLLRVLQEGKIRRIGGSTEESVDVRIIAATNKNLEDMIKKGSFREDLYYRLNVIPIYIPPLSERKEDIGLLAKFFIGKLGRKIGKRVDGFEIEFLNGLMEYDWPGNVRELENVIERAMNLCEGKLLTLDHLIIDFEKDLKRIERISRFEEDMSLAQVVEICEKQAITEALKKSGGIRKAARRLGVSHTTIMNKIKKYNIHWQ